MYVWVLQQPGVSCEQTEEQRGRQQVRLCLNEYVIDV